MTYVSRLLDDCAVFKVRQEGRPRGFRGRSLKTQQHAGTHWDREPAPKGPNQLAQCAPRPDPVDIRYVLVISTPLYCSEGRNTRSNPGASLERR
jgi:hypothetical protein